MNCYMQTAIETNQILTPPPTSLPQFVKQRMIEKICLVQVQLTQKYYAQSLIWLGFETTTSRSWTVHFMYLIMKHHHLKHSAIRDLWKDIDILQVCLLVHHTRMVEVQKLLYIQITFCWDLWVMCKQRWNVFLKSSPASYTDACVHIRLSRDKHEWCAWHLIIEAIQMQFQYWLWQTLAHIHVLPAVI